MMSYFLAFPWRPLAGFGVLGVITALTVWLSAFAPSLAVLLLTITFGMGGLVLLGLLPTPGPKTEALARSLLAIWLVLFVLWPRYALLHTPGLPGLSPARITYLLLVITWLYLIIRSPEYLTRIKSILANHRLFSVSLFVLFLIKFAGIFVSSFPLASLKGALNEVISIYLPMVITISIVRNTKQVYVLVFAYLVAVTASMLLGVVEASLNKNLFVGFVEIDSDYLEQSLRDKLRAGAYRIQSTFGHPLTLSECIAMSIPLYFSVLTKMRSSSRYLLAVFLTALSAYVLFKTGSRSGAGTAAAAAFLSVFAIIANNNRRDRQSLASVFHVLIAIALCFVAVIALIEFSDALIGKTAGEFNSGMARVTMWALGVRLAIAEPFLGYGQDMAALVLGYTGGGILTIDSYYLSVLLESGFIGLAFYCVILLYPIIRAISYTYSDHEHAMLALLLAASLGVFMVIKAILSLTHNHGIAMILVGLLLTTISRNDRVATVHPERKRPVYRI